MIHPFAPRTVAGAVATVLALSVPLSSPLSAQQPPLSASQQTPIRDGAVAPDGEASGTWASGETYKVRFDADGATFYPFVGRALPHQPFAWRTASVTVGGVELLGEQPPRLSVAGFDADYDRGPVREHYEVRAEGLEQTFVIARRPSTVGELVVTGAVATPLQLPPQAATHSALSLSLADGREVVRYGAAVAIDAAGRRTPMTTAVVDGRVELHLAAEVVAAAAFPLTVDPLVSTGSLITDTYVDAVDVLQEDVNGSAANGESWVAEAREVAAGDRDVRLYRYGADFAGTGVQVYSELSLWDSTHPQLALAASSGRAVCVHSATFASGSGIMVHRHDLSSISSGPSSWTTFVPSVFGESHWRPDIGGRRNVAGNQLLIVYQREPVAPLADTNVSEIWGTVYDATSASYVVAPFAIRSGGNRDHERPVVNQASGSHDWVVAWQEIDNSIVNDDWEIWLRTADGTGVLGSLVAGYETGFNTLHAIAPQIAGGGSRYLVSYAFREFEQADPRPSDDRGEEIRTQRFDFDLSAGTGARVGTPWIIQNQGLGQNALSPGGLAFDYVSTDHWCAAVLDHQNLDYHFHKLGYRGTASESFTYPLLFVDEPSAVAVTFDQAREFPIVYSVITAGVDRTASSKMTYEAVLPPTTLGFACGSGVWTGLSALSRKQAIGSQNLPLQLGSAPQDTVALLFVSMGEIAFPADPLGAPGCVLYPDITAPNAIGTIGAGISGGSASTAFNLPENLPNMDLTMQWVYLVPGANALNLLASEGLRLEIKH